MKQFSLRHILAISMVLLALVPAVLAMWLMSRAGGEAARALAGNILSKVAAVVQFDTEARLGQAHRVLNALFDERITPSQQDRARRWLLNPEQFEPMALALTRQSSDVPALHFATNRGDYFGLDAEGEAQHVSVRANGAWHRYRVGQAGDRSQPVPPLTREFEPRTRAWYMGAVEAKARVFSRVGVADDHRQLVVSLSQPVYDAHQGVAGVFAVNVHLQGLANALRTQHISAKGAAYVVDETGLLVASSAGDVLFAQRDGQMQRTSPADSANAVIRASFNVLEDVKSNQRADSVAMDTKLRRVDVGDQALLMVQRPFGQSLGLRWTLVVTAPESDFTAEISDAWRWALPAIAVLVGLSALIAAGIAAGLGRSLARLSQAAADLGRGKVPPADDHTRIREIHALSHVLHDSASQLSAYRVQVEAHAKALGDANETLEARVLARTAELATSREEALGAARAKAAFLATMSHEIRTPLNGVVGMTTLLAETPLDPEQRDYLHTIRLSSDQLLAVISDILDFSKIESGKLDLESEPVGIRSTVEEACDISALRAREKGLELIVDVPDLDSGACPSTILGDVTRLRQVLINLINNAVKFTSQGEVSIQARALRTDPTTGHVVIEFRVVDTGIGIPASRIDALFSAFTQVDASTTRKFGGTGLGLAISKRLVELMGGEIGVESEVGKGTTFWFTVTAPVAQDIAPVDGAGAGATVLVGRRALIVDDHPTNLRVLRRQLELWGVEVLSAESGAQALTVLASCAQVGVAELPDIVITDMHMPEMDGQTLARAIRAEAAWGAMPVVLLSSGFMPSGEEGAALFDARLLKPARQTHLFETIARCIAPDYAAAERSAAGSEGEIKNATVLVADDNAVNLKVACAMLSKLGYRYLTAVDGSEAVDTVAKDMHGARALSAILMDVNMPVVDGLQATRQILAAWGEHAPPIIALTAAASSEDKLRCEDAGMQDYLTKPLQVSALAQTLDKWIARAAQSTTTAEHASSHGTQPTVDTTLAPLDFDRLDEFKEFDDEALSMTREVIGLFLADAPLRIDAIEHALQAGDASALARAAHALKGAASNIGALQLYASCVELEATARSQLPVDGAACVARLQTQLQQTQAALQNWPKAAAGQ
jgi:signal transduction histidine kinase/DNA-binding response OmpR family regulator